MTASERVLRVAGPVLPIALALLVVALMLIVVGANLITTLDALLIGATGVSLEQLGEFFSLLFTASFSDFAGWLADVQTQRFLGTLAYWVPLLLCATGLLVTFAAGLWNIGVEGQMIMGAIGASAVALEIATRFPAIPGFVIIPLELIAAAAGGALWAALAAILKTRGGVHEIFGGVALNGLAVIATNYMISNPWQPPEGGSLHSTVEFPEQALLPLLGASRFSPLSLIVALLALALVAFLLRGTSWGLQLRALGHNLRSAYLLGVPSERHAVTAMMLCGSMAGLAGAVRVTSWFDSLRQSISGGIGFLAILIVLLAGMRPLATLVVALFFAALMQGGTVVQSRTDLKSSISGLIQGLLVLFVLLFGDWQNLFRSRQGRESAHE